MEPQSLAPMPRKALFSGGPELARLCLGTMMFADQTDEAEAARMLDAYFDAGGDFIDTADTYADGESERMLGRLLREHRSSCFLATKVGNPLDSVAGSGGISRQWIARAADDSLDRLQTDVIDLYYLHTDDNVTPLEETIGALGELIAAGKVRYWGFSNFRAWKIAEMIRIADGLGVARPVAAQPYYHMLNRVVEMEYLPACMHFGIGAVAYSPLARGVLTGKYRGGEVPEGSRAARQESRIMETEFREETIAAANRAADHATATGRDPIGLAIQWVLANQAVAGVLIGPKDLAQLKSYLGAVTTTYMQEDETVLSALCAPGQTPVAGHADPRYPYRGRVVNLGGPAGG